MRCFPYEKEVLYLSTYKKKIINNFRGTVFAASTTNVWELSSKPQLKSNIDSLVDQKYFELAIELSVRSFFLSSILKKISVDL